MAGRNRNRNQNQNQDEKRKPVAELYALIPQFEDDGTKKEHPAYVPLAALWETKGEQGNLTGRVLALPLNVLTGEPLRVLVQWRDEK